MALLFMDSFDHYATADLLEKWGGMVSATIVAGGGRRGTNAISFPTNGSAVQYLPTVSGTVGIFGAAVKFSQFGNILFAGFHESVSGRDQVIFRINADGSISALRSGATALGSASGAVLLPGGTTAAGVVLLGVYAYIEARVTIHDTAGTVDLRVNGVSVLALTAVDTSQIAGGWNAVWIGQGGTSSGATFDDFYVADGSGTAPWNAFLGDCRVDARVPTAPGATTGFTPSTGVNWQNVDDVAPNDGTDYNLTFSPGATDTFVVPFVPASGTVIHGVQQCISVCKGDVGLAVVSMAPVVRHLSVDYAGSAVAVGTPFTYKTSMNQTNPGTGVAWTEATFTAAEFGYKRVT